MIQKTDWAYLAGIIDGEGTIGLYKHQPRIVVAMSTQEPVEWIVDTFDVGCYTEGTWSGFRWGTYSRAGCKFILEGTLPYLRLKKDKAKEVIHEIEQFQDQDLEEVS